MIPQQNNFTFREKVKSATMDFGAIMTWVVTKVSFN